LLAHKTDQLMHKGLLAMAATKLLLNINRQHLRAGNNVVQRFG
jgi:hypothetical protein